MKKLTKKELQQRDDNINLFGNRFMFWFKPGYLSDLEKEIAFNIHGPSSHQIFSDGKQVFLWELEDSIIGFFICKSGKAHWACPLLEDYSKLVTLEEALISFKNATDKLKEIKQ